MTKKDSDKREKYIDVIAGIMIIWMMLCHCWYFTNLPMGGILKFIGFYMPWFFYKSGMFFTPSDSTILIKKDTHKLLRIFIIYSVIGWIVWCICGLIDGSLLIKDCLVQPIRTFLHDGCFSGNNALWFLPSLFIVRQCVNRLLLLNLEIRPFVLSIICFFIAFALFLLGWHRYCWWFGNIFSGMCFFLMGYWLKGKNKKILFVLSTIFYVFIIIAYGVGWISKFPFLYMHANKMYYGSYILFYPMALAGIIMTNNIFRILCKNMRFRALEYIGINAMNIYVFHWVLMAFVIFIANYFFNIDSKVTLFILLVVVCTLLLPITNEIIKSLEGKGSYTRRGTL